MKISKRLKEAKAKIEVEKVYTLSEAVALIKETSKVKFDASVEVHAKLGIDPKKSDQLIRDSVILPHGTGKTVRVAAFVPTDQIKEAKDAGADIAGDAELVEEIKKTGKCDFDVAITTPMFMKSLAMIARVLGQKGLMPNPKTGTIGDDVKRMIGELKKGKVSYKNDDTGNVHLVIGKVSFETSALEENFQTFFEALKK
ncbi:50S ribosomal protein L1, partial [Patescibacteria group bacterium]|nr:50S ribosomal protein L1 [Patescibacteria group bacterium]